MSASSRRIDRLQATFDHDGIVANAGWSCRPVGARYSVLGFDGSSDFSGV